MNYKKIILKATRISGITLCIFLVLSFLYISVLHRVYGYAGYCKYIELPLEKYLYYFESILFLLFWIPFFRRFSFKREQVRVTYKPIVLGGLLLNTIFLMGKIVQYPRIQLPHIFDAPCNDQFCGLGFNPLILMFTGFLITSVFYGWLCKKAINQRFFLIINTLLLISLIVTSLVVYNSIEYEMCAG